MPTRSMENSNSRLLISEILRKVSNAKTKKEKVDLLRKHNSNALRQLMIINFDESVICELPEGDVPYTPNDAPLGTDHTRLEQDGRMNEKYKRITKAVVSEAFPSIEWGGRS